MSSTPGATRSRTDDDNGPQTHKAHRPATRRETETKASFKTTEFSPSSPCWRASCSPL